MLRSSASPERRRCREAAGTVVARRRVCLLRVWRDLSDTLYLGVAQAGIASARHCAHDPGGLLIPGAEDRSFVADPSAYYCHIRLAGRLRGRPLLDCRARRGPDPTRRARRCTGGVPCHPARPGGTDEHTRTIGGLGRIIEITLHIPIVRLDITVPFDWWWRVVDCRAIRRRARQFPTDPPAHLSLACELLDRGRVEAAERELDVARQALQNGVPGACDEWLAQMAAVGPRDPRRHPCPTRRARSSAP